MSFLKGANLGGIASQVSSAVPEETQKKLIKEKLGPVIKKIHPELGEKILNKIMKDDVSKLAELAEDENALEQRVEKEAKQIAKEEVKKF